VYLSVPTSLSIRVVTLSTKVITKYVGNGLNGATASNAGEGGPATSAGINPLSIFMDTLGNLYVAEANYRVRKVAATGNRIIKLFAGSGFNTFTGMGGPATSATIRGATPYVAGDKFGNIFIGTDKRLFFVDGVNNFISLYSGWYAFLLLICLFMNPFCLFRDWRHRI
jgi:hypothetical protein